MPLVVGHSQAKYLSDYLDTAEFTVCSFSGYTTAQFIHEKALDELYPCFSDIVLLVGANDVGAHTTSDIVDDIADLCSLIHGFAPSASVYLCEVLPRGVNLFPGYKQSSSFLHTWNQDAASVNHGIRSLAESASWLHAIHLPDFHTLFGSNRRLLGTDGLHLSFEGTATLAGHISAAVPIEELTRPPPEKQTQPPPEESSQPTPEKPTQPTPEKTTKPPPVESTQPPPEEPTEEPTQPLTEGPYLFADIVKKKMNQPPHAKRPNRPLHAEPIPTTRSPHTQISNRHLHAQISNRLPQAQIYNRPPHAQIYNRPPTAKPSNRPPHEKSSNRPQNAKSTPVNRSPQTKHSNRPSRAKQFNRRQDTKATPANRSPQTTNQLPDAEPSNRPQDAELTSANRPQQPIKPKKIKTAKTRPVKSPSVLIETETHFLLNTDSNCNDKLYGGGKECDVTWVSTENRKLTYADAALYLNLDVSTTKEPPNSIALGAYLFGDSGDANNKEDWRADGYTWANHGGYEKTVDGKIVERRGFKHNDCYRYGFRFTGDDYNGRTIVNYVGDLTECKKNPHGNRKHGKRAHKRTKPSVIQTIKDNGLSQKPQELLDKLRSEASPESLLNGVGVPRNTRQIKNIQAKLRKQRLISHDALYGLHLLVDQLGDYIISIKTTPDLEVVVGNQKIFEEVTKLLQVKNLPLEFYYDTTFNLGDFYVSPLVCRHPFFTNKPVISVAFLIHERKFQKCHEQFIDIIKGKIPLLAKRNITVITDRETGIINAFQQILPNCKTLVCWNHLFNDIKHWIGQHGGTGADKKAYALNLETLLHCESKDEYQDKYLELKMSWSEAFLEYFDKHLYNTLLNHSGRWVLEENGIDFNPFSGITNNPVESFNAKLKRLIGNTEKDVDIFVLYLHFLQHNDNVELQKAFICDSEWEFFDQFRYAKRDPDLVQIPKLICHPDKLIDLINGDINALVDNKRTEVIQNMHDDILVEDNVDIANDIDTEEEGAIGILTENGTGENSSAQPKGSRTQRALALKVIMDKNISIVSDNACFVCTGHLNRKYLVTLFPKENCSCPSVRRCYHIIAAMLAIGMPIPDDKKLLNFGTLRKNFRPKYNKKCGTKAGRRGDTDADVTIVAAPDSILNKSKDVFSDCEDIVSSTPKSGNTSKLKVKTPKSNKKRSLTFISDLTNKLQKLDDLSDIMEETEKSQTMPENEFVALDQSRQDTSEQNLEPDYWIKDLELRLDDKTDLTGKNKLNSSHMEAVNILLRKQFGNSVNGFQLTQKVPTYDENNQRWTFNKGMQYVNSPACQIHHNHNAHWVASIYHDNTVYLLDSLGDIQERTGDSIISNGLKIQLSQVYGQDKSSLTIKVPSVCKQTNNIDCGLYAIAFVTAYCIRKTLCFDLTFDTSKLRSHLISCFENAKMTEFPLKNKRVYLSKKRPKCSREIEIKNYCVCNLPLCVDNVVRCDECGLWYHKHCISAPSNLSSVDTDFVCELCT